MEIHVPDRFEVVLRTDLKLQSALTLAVTEFEPWLGLSGMPFFPEYTDHGPRHVSDTLATASAIIGEDSWGVLTAADIAVLSLAILLHDCAMHITEDGFISLIRPGSPKPIISTFGDMPWPDLWADFLGESSRFDARKLHGLFGDTEPARSPGTDPKQWTLRDRLLIGEFLRRHHARLAHEIALWGIPSQLESTLRLKETPAEIADIAGLVARSHGQSVRSCFSYLSEKYDLREFKGIHCVFLMSVVRVADYLQVQSERAPRQMLQVRSLKSPISQGEWRAHGAIRDIRTTHEDPEAIFIDAAPEDARTYIKLRALLSAIQAELDGSWAALGEVYGRYDALRSLGLTLRRVRSNLDDEKTFAKSVSYLPYKAAFEAADADLLSLLIVPLYGERPEIGVRELIQNSVDACRELQDRLQRLAGPKPLDLADLDADVVVTLEQSDKKGGWLEIADRGIGMTADVVRNYFLKAGASFRRSDAWRRSYEDETGKSRVLRSGRFGVGVLASFLLGDSISVTTRSMDEPLNNGIAFEATIDSPEIELRRCSRAIGTTIRVQISREATWESLTRQIWTTSGAKAMQSRDWYCLSSPTVRRVFKSKDGKQETLEQRFSLPEPKSTLPEGWRRISHPDYGDIHWTYRNEPRLACNGIKVITRSDDYYYQYAQGRAPDELWRLGGLVLRTPNLSVFDPDGHLPLLLQRTGLATSKYPFQKQLLDDVVKDLIAFMLVNAPRGPIGSDSHSSYDSFYPGLDFARARWLMFFSTSHGTAPVDAWQLGSKAIAKFGRVVLLPSLSIPPKTLEDPELNFPEFVIPFRVPSDGGQDSRAWFRCVLGPSFPDESFGPTTYLNRKGSRMLVLAKTLGEFRRPGLIAKFYWENIEEEFRSGKWVLLRSGDCPELSVDFKKLAETNEVALEGLAEWYLAPDQVGVGNLSPIGEAWENIVKAPLIPFDPLERREALDHAFRELADFITQHEKAKATKT